MHGRDCWIAKQTGRGLSTPRLGSKKHHCPTLARTYVPLRIKEGLRKKFAKVANEFERRLHTISRELANVEGSLEVSQRSLCHYSIAYA